MASAFLELVLRTNVYVDGFNLYYGALRKTPFRWVNLRTLFQLLLPNNPIQDIKYFTALVAARPTDLTQPQRQQLYLRALATVPNISVHLGHFLVHEVMMALVVPPGQPQKFVKVIKTEEKGSDVNLATQLLHDAHMNRFDVAVVVSNDSDLLGPIKIVRNELNKKVGVLNPQKNPSRAILPHIDFIKQIRAGALQASLFPDQLSDQHGTFTKPLGW
ncbi:MAG: NYN domain-containing protein [Rhodoferax sp.]